MVTLPILMVTLLILSAASLQARPLIPWVAMLGLRPAMPLAMCGLRPARVFFHAPFES